MKSSLFSSIPATSGTRGMPNSRIPPRFNPFRRAEGKTDPNIFLFGIGRGPQTGVKTLWKPLAENSM